MELVEQEEYTESTDRQTATRSDAEEDRERQHEGCPDTAGDEHGERDDGHDDAMYLRQWT